jgi:diacylglycerol kinase family enzyme
LLLISNNPYLMSGPPDFGRRLKLDSGKLGIRVVTKLPEGGDIAAKRLDVIPTVHEWEATSFLIESDEPILAGLDGEALELASPLNLSIRPKGLRVIVPTGTRPGYVPVGDRVAARLLDLAQAGRVES